jgi:hypothetical protein
MTPQAAAWCSPSGRHPEGIREQSLANVRYLLNSFVLGRELEADFDLKQLHPRLREVWEFRSKLEHPRSQLRLFGWFPQPNHFIAVHGKRREDLESSRGPKWDRAMQRVVDARNTLLPGEVLFSGGSYGDYIH